MSCEAMLTKAATASPSAPAQLPKSPPATWSNHVTLFPMTHSVPKMVSKAIIRAAATRSTTARPMANFAPDIWSNHFASFSLDNSSYEYESYSKRVAEMKEKVKNMLLASASDPIENVAFIDLLCRLGVSYHFEKEIEEKLKRVFVVAQLEFGDGDNHKYDLYTTSLVFRVLRQHGYRMSCHIFNKFKDAIDGKFKETLAHDARGMLSLFEAAHLRVHGEDILEEALSFTRSHLNSAAHKSAEPLRKQVLQTLEHPPHKGIPRLEARRYISFYREDDSPNKTLLNFAELDFNRVQLLHQDELGQLTRWWKDSNYSSKLCHSRQRTVEAYFVALGVYFEPQYSHARIILSKFLCTVAVFDDIFDAYATFEELQRFTDAIQRWDISSIEKLPDYIKTSFSAFSNIFVDAENEVKEEGRSYVVQEAREAVKELARVYLREAKWRNEDYVPKFGEYIENAMTTAGCIPSTMMSMVGMGQLAEKRAFQWVKSTPKCIKSFQLVGRILNDVKGHKGEQERKHVASSVECYMEEYGCSEEDAIEELNGIVENAWKDLNEECLMPIAESMHIVTRILNFTRSMEVIYKFDDGITHPTYLKDYITSLFVHPLSITD